MASLEHLATRKSKVPTRKESFHQADWLAVGLRQIVEDGMAGLTIERLCAAARKTRGSFYHHFKDHEAYVRALMQHWRKVQTDDVIAQIEASGDMEVLQHSLHTLANRLDHRLDMAVRRLAASQPIAAETVREADEARLAYLAKLYREASGVPTWQAAALARFDYTLFVGSQVLWPDAEPLSVFEIKALVLKLEAAGS